MEQRQCHDYYFHLGKAMSVLLVFVLEFSCSLVLCDKIKDDFESNKVFFRNVNSRSQKHVIKCPKLKNITHNCYKFEPFYYKNATYSLQKLKFSKKTFFNI